MEWLRKNDESSKVPFWKRIIFFLAPAFAKLRGLFAPLKTLFQVFKKTGLKVLEKIEIPYYGSRKIKKYFFKLI